MPGDPGPVEKAKESAGVPAWVMTFADLMTLLMCFYVLMLSFSEMDVIKFKQLSGSMKDAFGVQTDFNVKNIPKGTSLIAKEFSPGAPKPTPMNEVRQFTVNSNKNTLDVGDVKKLEEQKQREDRAQREAARIKQALEDEIEAGTISVRTEGYQIIIHILERGSFGLGVAELEPDFLPVLAKMRELIQEIPGTITVAGHTDDLPIHNEVFRSNWDLSAARAASVVHELADNNGIDPGRLLVTGHADTQPRMPNDSPQNRAANRRVDITVVLANEDRDTWERFRDAAAQAGFGGADEPE